MSIKRAFRFKDGKFAIYDVDTDAIDHLPFTDPADHIDRLHHHSDLPSPSIIKTGGSFVRTGTVNLSSRGSNVAARATHQLFAHGRPGTPLVFGRVLINGTTLAPLNGSLPLNWTGNTLGGLFHSRAVHLGANETHVNLREQALTCNAVGAQLAAMTLDWEVYVTNVLLDGTPDGNSDPGVALRITPELLTAGEGAFDSRNRYIREASTGAVLNMAQSKTTDANPPTSSTALNVSARYNIGSYTQQFGPNVGSHTATFKQMKF